MGTKLSVVRNFGDDVFIFDINEDDNGKVLYCIQYRVGNEEQDMLCMGMNMKGVGKKV